MKKFLTIICIFIFSFSIFGQNTKTESYEDVTISIPVGKISKTIGKIVKYTISEINQFKQETEENTPQEVKDAIDSLKVRAKYEAKYAHDAIHAGYVQGLQGKEYTPPYKNRYIIEKKND